MCRKELWGIWTYVDIPVCIICRWIMSLCMYSYVLYRYSIDVHKQDAIRWTAESHGVSCRSWWTVRSWHVRARRWSTDLRRRPARRPTVWQSRLGRLSWHPTALQQSRRRRPSRRTAAIQSWKWRLSWHPTALQQSHRRRPSWRPTALQPRQRRPSRRSAALLS